MNETVDAEPIEDGFREKVKRNRNDNERRSESRDKESERSRSEGWERRSVVDSFFDETTTSNLMIVLVSEGIGRRENT